MPDTAQIIDLRSSKNRVDPWKAYHFLHEIEQDLSGNPQKVNTIFLTNSECPWKCLMCDLWKNTLDQPTPKEAIPYQIEQALDKLPDASVLKLYNSGNFFDKRAIPQEDYRKIARLIQRYDRVVVENHPRLCGQNCVDFQSFLNGTLEIAIGLETIHPEVLPKLNKKIKREDYSEAVDFLKKAGIDVRTFLLLNLPYVTDSLENKKWTLRSLEFAFTSGSDRCSIIPTRATTGIMKKLEQNGQFREPSLQAIEDTFDQALITSAKHGHITVDTWDLHRFSRCLHCVQERKERLKEMNRVQQIIPNIACNHCGTKFGYE